MIPAKKQTLCRYKWPGSCRAIGNLPKDEKVTPEALLISATYEDKHSCPNTPRVCRMRIVC